ncbi:unnamed protein product [Kuraishia capsulata CBS 1993]|uniref:Zn(2)-C6 fungal-type domain-containing protein n=1 Tax=Kuraishia capsulata CBS 1993 TaxID=1382522 RepID=W6MM27_9ASCO|nr:uncharacterized protein KUCA_T00003567001 [Kuraishia capsulata CBS 1993]CDK27589.1 unnamed protein product [Kuraishia capsulata CBS 1993]
MPKAAAVKIKTEQPDSRRKRNRVPMSCTICRRRKVKCDKRKPKCANCKKRGVQHLCHYLVPTWAKPLLDEEIGDYAVEGMGPGDEDMDMDNSSSQEDEEEMNEMRATIRALEKENEMLKLKKANNTPPIFHSDEVVELTRTNYLYTTQPVATMIKFPIAYHIGVFSWMFFVKNDFVLNDLWSKISGLRKHYDSAYGGHHNSPNNLLEGEIDFTSSFGAFKREDRCPAMDHEPASQQCPVTGKAGASCPSGSDKAAEVMPKYAYSSADAKKEDDVKVCPLMIGDARAMFREKISQMSSLYTASASAPPDVNNTSPQVTAVSATILGEPSRNQDGSECPVVGCDANSKRPKRQKKVKQVTAPPSVKKFNFNDTKQALNLIEKQLPNRKIIWLLIDRFFENLYIHVPFVDEASFRLKIATIIGSSSQTVQKVKLSDYGYCYGEEFLTIMLMLVILRLSWLSLPRQTAKLSTVEQTLIKPENIVPMVLTDLVKETFMNMKIVTRPSVTILQIGLFLKYYNIFSPEDGFDLDDTGSSTNIENTANLNNELANVTGATFLNELITLAKTIGVNRDPLIFENFAAGSQESMGLFRKRHLWRKLWFGLLNLSLVTNLSLGDLKKGLPIEIDNDPRLGIPSKTWDTKLPGSVEEDLFDRAFSGLALIKEKKIVENFRIEQEMNVLLHNAMDMFFSLNRPVSKSKVDDLLERLRRTLSDDGIFEVRSCFQGESKNVVDLKADKFDNANKIFRMKTHLVGKSMRFALNYLMFLNHEIKLNNFKGTEEEHAIQRRYVAEYFESTLLLAIDNYNIFVQFFFENNEKRFPDSTAELMVYPFLMILNHRSMEFLISLILRLQQDVPLNIEILAKNEIDKKDLLIRLFQYLQVFLSKMESLTKKYYYAWRLRKLIKFFYKVLLNSNRLFAFNLKNAPPLLPQAPLFKSEPKKEEVHCPIYKDLNTNFIPTLSSQRKETPLPIVPVLQSHQPIESPLPLTPTYSQNLSLGMATPTTNSTVEDQQDGMDMMLGLNASEMDFNFFNELNEFGAEGNLMNGHGGLMTIEPSAYMETEIDFTYVDFSG